MWSNPQNSLTPRKKKPENEGREKNNEKRKEEEKLRERMMKKYHENPNCLFSIIIFHYSIIAWRWRLDELKGWDGKKRKLNARCSFHLLYSRTFSRFVVFVPVSLIWRMKFDSILSIFPSFYLDVMKLTSCNSLKIHSKAIEHAQYRLISNILMFTNVKRPD